MPNKIKSPQLLHARLTFGPDMPLEMLGVLTKQVMADFPDAVGVGFTDGEENEIEVLVKTDAEESTVYYKGVGRKFERQFHHH